MCLCNPLHPINMKKTVLKRLKIKIILFQNDATWAEFAVRCCESRQCWEKLFSDGLILRFWTRWRSGGAGRVWKQHTCGTHRHLGPSFSDRRWGREATWSSSSSSFRFLCFFDRVNLDMPSIQLDGAAVLLGFFSTVVLLARAHQAVQQVSCKDAACTTVLAYYSSTGVT